MSQPSLDDLRLEDFLTHILEASRRIIKYTECISRDDFLGNEYCQDAVTRNLEIIGEASGHILKRYSNSLKKSDIELFKGARGMRNVLAHGYFGINYSRVWDTIRHDIRPLQDRAAVLREDQLSARRENIASKLEDNVDLDPDISGELGR
jgi:uncharacterized protein with HEPN domain